jgi:SAM-dependent methyltransferase
MNYQDKYESHYQVFDETGPGGGDENKIGLLELEILKSLGLNSSSLLLDFGCGSGRLARKAIDFLESGLYVGSDISSTALKRLEESVKDSPKKYFTLHNDGINLVNLVDHFKYLKSPDIICLFSVVTHLEIEDAYKVLVELKKLMSPRTILVLSFLEFPSKISEKVFLEEAAINYEERYTRVRNIIHSKDFIKNLLLLAGYNDIQFIPGDQKFLIKSLNLSLDLGQSLVTCRVE